MALAGLGGSGREAPSRGTHWRLGLRLRRARTPADPRAQKQRFSKPAAVVRARERTLVIAGSLTLKYTGKVMSRGTVPSCSFSHQQEPLPQMKTRPSAGGSMAVPVQYQSREPSVATEPL